MVNDDLAKYLASFDATIDCLRKHNDIIVPVTAFMEAKTKFGTMVTDFRNKIEHRDIVFEGKVKVKETRKEELVQSDITLLSAMQTLGSKTHNDELFVFATKYSYSEFIRMRPVNLISRSNEVQAKAVTLLPDLLGHGIVEPQVTANADLINAFKDASAAVDSTSGKKTAETEELEADCRKIREFLKKEMDGYVTTLRQANPEFYNEYQHVRETKNYGIRHKKPAETPGTDTTNTDTPGTDTPPNP